MRSLKRSIEIASDVAVILAVLGVGLLVVRNWNFHRSMAPEVGTTLTAIPGYRWADHDATLLLAMRQGCHYCEESMPLYRKLVEMDHAGQIKPHLVAVLPDSRQSAANLLESQHLAIDYVADLELSRLHVLGTPALLLLDGRGKVEQVWMGELSVEDQKNLFEAISKSTAVADAHLCATDECR